MKKSSMEKAIFESIRAKEDSEMQMYGEEPPGAMGEDLGETETPEQLDAVIAQLQQQVEFDEQQGRPELAKAVRTAISYLEREKGELKMPAAEYSPPEGIEPEGKYSPPVDEKCKVSKGSKVNPYAVCTASVGRDDKAKYKKCVKDAKGVKK